MKPAAMECSNRPVVCLVACLAVCLMGWSGSIPGTAFAAEPRPTPESNSPPALSRPATLQVGLWALWRDREISVAPAPDAVATLHRCQRCSRTAFKQPMRVEASGDGIAFGAHRTSSALYFDGPIILSAHGESLTLRNPLRVAARDGHLVLAVTLPVESYVERVVASESGSSDSPESLKALAIVVRSFALHQKHGHGDYDVCDSTHCQLLHWAGAGYRNAEAHSATLSTAGETLWYRGQRAQAWFHQNCGGRTATPAEVWPANASAPPVRPMPWFVSRPDPYCTAGGAREWSSSLSLAELTRALGDAGLVRPGWQSLSVAQRGESGRARMLVVGTAQISAEDFRLAVGRSLGWSKILSTWFEVSSQSGQFYFHGRGSGHGVGLCQAGAAQMAVKGRDRGEILSEYFPGATSADETSGQSWQTLRGQSLVIESLAGSDGAFMPSLSRALDQAKALSGLQPLGPIVVRAFPSVPAFRDATLAPGWVAAFTEGNWIGTQPLATLAARKLLVPVMRHEFLHALVEAQAAANTPLWLREGLVEAWAERAGSGPHLEPPAIQLDDLDRRLARAATEGESASAHRAAAWYAQKLLDRFGSSQVLTWLRSGVPSTALSALR